MNVWLSLLVPVLTLNVVLRFVQFLFDKERFDKTLTVIIITMVQLVALVVLVMVVNGMGVTKFLYVTALVTVLLNYIQTAIDSKSMGLRMSYGSSFAVVSLVSTLVYAGLFWWLVV